MTKRWILAICLFLVSIPSLSRAEDIWISQSGGTACGQSTQSAAWFNNSANWGGGAGRIDPGDTVRFCGTITTNLTIQASGTSGNNIVLDGTNATLNCRLSGGGDHYVIETPRSYISLQNITFASGRTGDFPALRFYGASNITVSNVTIPNAKGSAPVHFGNASYVTIDQLNLDGLDEHGINLGRAHHVTLSRLHIVTATTISSGQKDIITSYGGNNITLEKSYIHHRLSGSEGSSAKNDTWETGCSDGTWTTDCPAPALYSHHNTLRYNMIIHERTGTVNHNYYLTGPNLGGDQIYGNVFVLKGTNTANQCIVYTYVGHNTVNDIYNNTFVMIDTRPTRFLLVENQFGAVTINFKNNIVYNALSAGTAVCLAATKNGACGAGTTTLNHSHNAWNGFASNSWPGGTCSAWAGTGEKCNSDPLFSNYANNDFSLRDGSIAMDAGIDVGSQYRQQIKPGSTWPNPTLISPSIMSIGAYGSDARRPMSPTIVGIK